MSKSMLKAMTTMALLKNAVELRNQCYEMSRGFIGENSAIYIPQHKKPRTKSKKGKRK